MSDSLSYDAAIIGAGPAGSAAGTQLAKAGLRVVILEKEKFPRFAIGEDAFSVVKIVRALHAGAFVARLVDRPFDHNTILVQLPHGQILFSTAPALISLLAQCPIISVGVSKQRDGKHRISARLAIEPSWLPAGRAETLAHYTK